MRRRVVLIGVVVVAVVVGAVGALWIRSATALRGPTGSVPVVCQITKRAPDGHGIAFNHCYQRGDRVDVPQYGPICGGSQPLSWTQVTQVGSYEVFGCTTTVR